MLYKQFNQVLNRKYNEEIWRIHPLKVCSGIDDCPKFFSFPEFRLPTDDFRHKKYTLFSTYLCFLALTAAHPLLPLGHYLKHPGMERCQYLRVHWSSNVALKPNPPIRLALDVLSQKDHHWTLSTTPCWFKELRAFAVIIPYGNMRKIAIHSFESTSPSTDTWFSSWVAIKQIFYMPPVPGVIVYHLSTLSNYYAYGSSWLTQVFFLT